MVGRRVGPPLLALLLGIQATSGIASTPVIAGTTVFSLVGSPRYAPGCGDSPCFSISYENNSNATVVGIAFAVIHNKTGQTVFYATGTLMLAPKQNGTFYIVVPDSPTLFPLGAYNATFFVITPSWVAISGTSSLSYEISGY